MLDPPRHGSFMLPFCTCPDSPPHVNVHAMFLKYPLMSVSQYLPSDAAFSYLHQSPCQPLQPGDRHQSSESDVCRRQILTSKVDPRAVRVNIFKMAVDP